MLYQTVSKELAHSRNGTPYITSLFMATSLKSHGIYQRLAVITFYLCPSMELVLLKATASFQIEFILFIFNPSENTQNRNFYSGAARRPLGCLAPAPIAA